MALNLGTGLIETGGSLKMPKLQAAMDKALTELGWDRTYEGKGPPEEDPEDGATEFALLATAEGLLGIRISEVNVVRDLARLLSEKMEGSLEVFMTAGSLFGRRSVEVTCRRFAFDKGEERELPVMVTHTAEVTDVEHNELRQAANALQSRINNANDSLLQTEGTADLELKKITRYKRAHKKIKFSSPRLARLLSQVESCESFEIVHEGDQAIVRLVLAGGAKSLAYVKDEELAELEKAIDGRPEILHRRR